MTSGNTGPSSRKRATVMALLIGRLWFRGATPASRAEYSSPTSPRERSATSASWIVSVSRHRCQRGQSNRKSAGLTFPLASFFGSWPG